MMLTTIENEPTVTSTHLDVTLVGSDSPATTATANRASLPTDESATRCRSSTATHDGPPLYQSAELTDALVAQLQPIIASKVRSVVRNRSDREDAEQEIWLRLSTRLRQFQPDRGSLGTYLYHCIESALVDVVRHLRAPQRRALRTINQPLRDGDVEWGATFCSEAQEFALGHRSRSAADQRDLAIDLRKAVTTLPQELRVLCNLLRESTPVKTAAALQMSKRTLYRRLTPIRLHLQDRGLQAYVD